MTMLCGCGKSPPKQPPILDIEKVFQDYAWRGFMAMKGPVARLFLRRRDFDINVPMNFFHFEDTTTKLENIAKHDRVSAVKHSVPGTVVLATNFRNNTPTAQTYKFRMERTRKASLSVTFQKGFSFGAKAHFKLNLSKLVEIGGEANKQLQITKTTGENFEESMTFEVTSDINVKDNSHYTANVAFTDKEISFSYTVYTTMKMPTGKAPITICRKKDGELYHTTIVSNLKKVFEDVKDVKLKTLPCSGEFKSYGVEFETTGIVEGTLLSKQDINLNSTSIAEKEAASSKDTSSDKVMEISAEPQPLPVD